MTFDKSVSILYPMEHYDIREYALLRKIFSLLALSDMTFMYLGENVDKMERIKNETNLNIIRG